MVQVEKERRVAVSGPTVETPNWMLVLVCVVASLTAIWEAVGAGRGRLWFDLSGYLALALGTALFAIQAAVSPRRPDLADRLQSPAVYLTAAGVFLLLLSQSGGRRL